jgi:hypothetical protein
MLRKLGARNTKILASSLSDEAADNEDSPRLADIDPA